jgi:hypothetical protein
MRPRPTLSAARLASLTLCALTFAGGGGTWAAEGEQTIRLLDGPGRDLTTGRCIICHSLDYIVSNAPVMNRAAWQKTVQKMKDRFGAPLTDEEAQQILDYLDGGYSGRR